MTDDFIKRLVFARTKLGMSQRKMAKAVGCSSHSWENYEAGRNLPGYKILSAIAMLGVSLDWLTTGEGQIWQTEATPKAGAALDHAFLGRLTDAIRAAYKAEGQGVADRQLGELAGRWYDELANIEDAEDRLMALGAKVADFRRELRDATANGNEDKRRA